jgi:hypothetical protein
MSVALSFLFGFALSNHCVRPWMERAFDAPKGLQTPLHDHTLFLGCLLPIFLKINISPRQINLKIWGFERGHSYQVIIGVYLCLIELKLGWEKLCRRSKEEKLKTTDRTLNRTRRYSTTASSSGHHLRVRSREDGSRVKIWPDSVSVRSTFNGRVRLSQGPY